MTMLPATAQPTGWPQPLQRTGPRRVHIYLLFFFWTLFSVYLYSRFSTLGDSNSYLTGAYDDDQTAARTLAITKIAEAVFAIVHNDLLAHLVFAAFAATGVAYMVRHARLHGRYAWPLLAIILTPNFGVWSSVIGRESLFVGLLGFFLGAVLAYYRHPTMLRAFGALLCVGAMTFIRAPYGIGLALFLMVFLAYRSGPRTYLSLGLQVILFGSICAVALALVWPYLDGYIAGEVLPKAKGYFTISSPTTRTWIQMDTTRRLLLSLWWSLPLALVGPTPGEVAARPLMAPFFLSGVVVLCCLAYSIVASFRAPPGRVRKILLIGWLPSVALVLVAYVPFGVYNSGSAIRYASCFLLFLIFPSLLLSAEDAEANSQPAVNPALVPELLRRSLGQA